VSVRILVIGCNSFSGSDFVRHGLNLGHEILGLSRRAESDPPFRRYFQHPNLTRFKFAQVDLNHIGTNEEKLISEFSPDLIVNYSAQSMVGQSWEQPEDWYETNVVAISKLINFLSKLPSLQKYIHVTTPEVYGSTADWISEDTPFNPSTPYAVSRAAGDMHLRIMNTVKGFPVIFTRAANVFGSGQQLYRVVPKAFLSALAGVDFPLQGGGFSRRSFIHISDVSSATMQIALEGRIGDTYHISTNDLITIRDLVSEIYEMCGQVFDAQGSTTSDRLGKDAGYFLSSEKLRSELGWRPEFSLKNGLEEVKDWVTSNQQLFSTLSWEYSHVK
jgi:dTDP-glucose 4,6-dehydratase